MLESKRDFLPLPQTYREFNGCQSVFAYIKDYARGNILNEDLRTVVANHIYSCELCDGIYRTYLHKYKYRCVLYELRQEDWKEQIDFLQA